MIDRTLAFTITGAVMLILIVLEMVRRRRLREEFVLLWLAIATMISALASNRGLLDFLAGILGISYPPSVLILIGFGSMIIVALYFSVISSRLLEENKSLAQEIAIMRLQMRTVEKKLEQENPVKP